MKNKVIVFINQKFTIFYELGTYRGDSSGVRNIRSQTLQLIQQGFSYSGSGGQMIGVGGSGNSEFTVSNTNNQKDITYYYIIFGY